MFVGLLGANHAESSGNFLKKSVWDPKLAKLEQNPDFGHVRTYSWLHKLRNTQGKTYETYLGKIYGIYKEYIRNIHKYLWFKIIRNKELRPNGVAAKRPPLWGCRRRRPLVVFLISDCFSYFLSAAMLFFLHFHKNPVGPLWGGTTVVPVVPPPSGPS